MCCVYIYTCIYIYIYTCITYIYIYIYRHTSISQNMASMEEGPEPAEPAVVYL